MPANEVEDGGEGGGFFELFEVDIDREGFSDEAEEGDVGERGEDLLEAVDEQAGLGVGHGGVGGRSRARTADLLLVRQAL